MTVAGFSFVAIVLFMIHEFDEIIFVRAWLKSRRKSENADDLWTRAGDKHYPSTAALALMIAEEFILISLLLGLCIVFDWREFALGILIAHNLHLIGHLFDAARSKRWSPGAPTAAITLPLIAVLIWVFVSTNELNPVWIMLGILIAAIILLPNLAMLHRLAPRFQKFIDKVYKS